MTANKKILIPIILVIVLCVLSYLLFKFFDSKFNLGKKIQLYFASTIVKKGSIKSQMSFFGTIDFTQHVNLQFQQVPTNGIQIAWIGAKVGDKVKANQVVARLDTTDLQKNFTQAQANYRSAKANLDLILDNTHLSQYGLGGFSNIGTANETQTQKTQRQQAEESVNTSYDDIQKTQNALNLAYLKSPFDGIMVREDISTPGANITDPSTAQFEIINPTTFFFNVDMDETEVSNIHEGDKGVVLLNSFPSQYMVSTINQISFATHKDKDSNDMYSVRISIDGLTNSDNKFRFGMTGNFIYNTLADNVLYIVKDFLHTDDTGSYVYVGRDRKKTYVTTGINDGTNIEVVSGLVEEDVVYY